MPFEDDGNLEDILTTPPQAEAEEMQQVEQPVDETQVDPTPQLQVSEPKTEPAVSSLPASLVSRAKAAGLQLDGINSLDQFSEHLLDRWNQERAYAEFGRTSLANPKHHADEINKTPASEEGEGQESEFDENGHFSNLWKVAELDEACKYAIQNGIVTLGEDGLFQAKPGCETMALPLLQTINQSHLAQKEQVGKLFEGNFYQNIDKGLWPAFEARLNRMLDERLNSQFQSYEQQVSERSFVDNFVNENKSWLYDASGNLSADGLRFQQAVNELRQNGITDSQVLASYAIKIAGINTQPPATVQSESPVRPSGGQNTEKARDEQGRFLPAGKPAPVPPQKTKQESFIDKARRHVTHSDSRGAGINSGSDYQVANEADLENMFTDAWKHAAVV